MLSEDITGAIGTGIRAVFAIARGAVKGALIGGFAMAAVALLSGGAAVPAMILGAKVGAVILGATSIIPSVREWPEMFKQTVAVPSRVAQYSKEVAQAAAPNLTQDMDNPYYVAGKGAQMKQRGDEAQASVSRN